MKPATPVISQVFGEDRSSFFIISYFSDILLTDSFLLSSESSQVCRHQSSVYSSEFGCALQVNNGLRFQEKTDSTSSPSVVIGDPVLKTSRNSMDPG